MLTPHTPEHSETGRMPESPDALRAYDEALTSAGLIELRRRAQGLPKAADADVGIVSDEAERLLIAHGELGELWYYIYSTKQERWEAAEPALIEMAPAGMLMSYLTISGRPWPEALDLLEDRFNCENIGDVGSLVLHRNVLPADLFDRLAARVRDAAPEQYRNTFETLLETHRG